ncbi:MAG: ChaN family lipoprotein [Bacteroidota bacterium]
MNSRKNILIIFAFLIGFSLQAQQKDAYRIYNAKGKKVSYKKMLKHLSKTDIILFGEFHNNPISHWLQIELANDLYALNADLSFGAEMIETDNQQELSDYLSGTISEKEFKEAARLWSNYDTDYAPLVNFAKDQKLPFYATNIPRRYASKIYKEGGFSALDSLSKEEKDWIAPLPIPFDIELKTYQDMLEMMGNHANEDMVKAQAIKDATMAYFILANKKENELFLHFNGAYHSNFYEGIVWYLNQYDDSQEAKTISTVEQDDIYKLENENKGLADFIICVPSTMTKTY